VSAGVRKRYEEKETKEGEKLKLKQERAGEREEG
jgi:hypothetical protein